MEARHSSMVMQIQERYRVKGLLGVGGMGEVYEAEDEELRVGVALKALRFDLAREERALRRLKQEVLLARSITHPQVCRVYDLGRHGGNGHEAVGSLRWSSCLARHSWSECSGKGGQGVGGFAAREAYGVGTRSGAQSGGSASRLQERERDGGRDNGDERAVVADFGLSIGVRGGEVAEGVASGVGTPGYMAPEQVQQGVAGPAADIYAFGVVMYEMVTGEMPFRGRDSLKRRLTELAPSASIRVVSELEDRWEAVILRCLAREPAERFGRVEEVWEALSASGALEVKSPDWVHFCSG